MSDIKKKTTYNHAFDIGWALSNSQYEDAMDCLEHEKEKVFEALKKRVEDLRTGRFHPNEYFEAIGHYDTFEEEQTDLTEGENDE